MPASRPRNRALPPPPAPVTANPLHAPARILSPTIQGMGWMLVSGVLFAVMTGVARMVATDLDPMQAAFLRYALGFLVVLPFLMSQGRFRLPRTRRPGRHLLRGICHGCGVMLWFYGLAQVPIADVQALSFLSPVFATAGAVLFLGERTDRGRIVAIAVAFLGMVVILRPGLQEITWGAIALVVSTPLFAISELMAKTLVRTESSATVVAFQSIFVSLACLPGAILLWQTPTLIQVLLLLLIAALATVGHIAWIKALMLADLSATQPIKFLQLIWVSAIGYLAFSEVPDAFTLLGGLIIFIAASYAVHGEASRRAAARRAAAGAVPPASGPPGAGPTV